MRNDVKPIVFGAMSVAFMGIFYLINQFTGALFEPYIIFISPLPSLIYTVKYTNKMGFWVVLCGFLIGFILGNFTSVFYLAAGFVGGYVLAIVMKQRKSKAMQILSLFLVLLLANFMMFFVFANMFGFDFMLEVETMAKMMSEFDVVSRVFSYQDLLSIMPICMVAAIFLDSYLTAMVSYMLGTIILLRLKLYIPINSVKALKPQKYVGYLLMGGMLAYMFANKIANSLAIYALISCVGIVCCAVLAFYGFKGIKSVLRRKGAANMNLLIWAVFFLLFPMSFMLFGIAGFMYICSDFFENVLK